MYTPKKCPIQLAHFSWTQPQSRFAKPIFVGMGCCLEPNNRSYRKCETQWPPNVLIRPPKVLALLLDLGKGFLRRVIGEAFGHLARSSVTLVVALDMNRMWCSTKYLIGIHLPLAWNWKMLIWNKSPLAVKVFHFCTCCMKFHCAFEGAFPLLGIMALWALMPWLGGRVVCSSL